MAKKTRQKHYYDYSLVFAVIFLTSFGLLMIYSSSSYMAQIDPKTADAAYYLKRHGMIALAGFLLMIGVSKVDYHWTLKWAGIMYVMSYVLMILVSLIGREVN